MDKENITISRIEYLLMLNDSMFVEALREAGVDNWDGWSEAWKIHKENKQKYLCPHGYDDSDQCPDCCH